jgi:hypothetical protein
MHASHSSSAAAKGAAASAAVASQRTVSSGLSRSALRRSTPPPPPPPPRRRLAGYRRHSRKQAGCHRAAREHPCHLTQHSRHPLVPRQSASGMEPEIEAAPRRRPAALRGAARQKEAAATAAANPSFHLSVFKPKVLEKILDSEMSGSSSQIVSALISSQTS